MKTPDEIKKSLRIHSLNHRSGCIGCAYRDSNKISFKCQGELFKDLREYIKRLEAERDAAVEDIKSAHNTSFSCETCKHYEINVTCDEPYTAECPNCKKENCPCAGCGAYSENWQWRGVQKEE